MPPLVMMNTELLAGKVVDWVAKTTEQIGDFAAKEIPPFIHEYLTWKFWEAAIGAIYLLIPCLICAVLLICFAKKVWLWAIKYLDESGALSILVPVLFYGVCMAVFFGNFPKSEIKDMIQIKLAPKVYLVEKAAELYKEHNNTK